MSSIFQEYHNQRQGTTYTVMFRQGGELRCRWEPLALRFATRKEAEEYAQELTKAGYKYLVFDTDNLRVHGIPVGWDTTTSAEDWEYDASDRFWYHRSIRPDLFKNEAA